MAAKEHTTQFLAGFLFGVVAAVAAYYLAEETTVTQLLGGKIL